MPSMVRVTWISFMEECRDGSMKDQLVKHGPWALRVPTKSGFGRGKQQGFKAGNTAMPFAVEAGDDGGTCVAGAVLV